MLTVEPLTSDHQTDTRLIANCVRILSNDGAHFCVLPKKYFDTCAEQVKNMKIYDDDLWIVTFPKTGTTWTQEMLWLINNDLNYQQALTVDLSARFPFLEVCGVIEDLKFDIESFENMPRPRHIKSHLPMFLLPDQLWLVKPKIVYVARNPKDVAVSWYHHHSYIHEYQGTQDSFINAFINDEVIYSPFKGHIIEFWKIRLQPNILFLFYEDMKGNLEREVKKTIEFLGKNFSDSEVKELCRYLSFESMRNNKTVNKEEVIRRLKERNGEEHDPKVFTFFRKGQVGGYRNELTKEQNEKIDEYAGSAGLKEQGIVFKFNNDMH